MAGRSLANHFARLCQVHEVVDVAMVQEAETKHFGIIVYRPVLLDDFAEAAG